MQHEQIIFAADTKIATQIINDHLSKNPIHKRLCDQAKTRIWTAPTRKQSKWRVQGVRKSGTMDHQQAFPLFNLRQKKSIHILRTLEDALHGLLMKDVNIAEPCTSSLSLGSMFTDQREQRSH